MGRKADTTEYFCPFCVVIDTREQCPFTFLDIRTDARDGRRTLAVPMVRKGIPSGDYSIEGCEGRVAVERKGGAGGVADLFNTLGEQRRRKRFERELSRLNDMEAAFVVVEADWSAILRVPLPRPVLDMLADFSAKLASGDSSQPWGQWAAAIESLIPPQPRSRLNPKTVFRSVVAWQLKYPRVHWWMCPSRRFAEVLTLRLLQRWWRVNGIVSSKVIAKARAGELTTGPQ